MDDAGRLTAEQLRCLTASASAVNAKLPLVTGADRPDRTTALVDSLAAHLPWARHRGAATSPMATAFDRARTRAELGAANAEIADLLALHEATTRAYGQRLSHRDNRHPETPGLEHHPLTACRAVRHVTVLLRPGG